MTGDDDGDGNGDDQKQEIPPRHLQDNFMFCSCLLNAEKLPESTFQAKKIDGKSAQITPRKFCDKSA